MNSKNNDVNKSNNKDGKEEMYTMVKAVVHRINTLCEEHDMSIYELSKLSGITQSTLNEIMQERSERPRIDTIKKIAFGFGMNLTEFFDDPVFERIEGVDDREPPVRLKQRHRRKKVDKNDENLIN